MMPAMTVWIVMATVVAFIPATGMQSAKQETKSSALSFIEEAAEGQQVEIALGQLASEQAGDEQVKRFGSQIGINQNTVRTLCTDRHLEMTWAQEETLA
jgi:Domain of unknown function (DUF4142)